MDAVSPFMSPTHQNNPHPTAPRATIHPLLDRTSACLGASLNPKVLGSIPSGGTVQKPGVCRASFVLAWCGCVPSGWLLVSNVSLSRVGSISRHVFRADRASW
jgi:hypothetical protein